MNILLISGDQGILKNGSQVRARMEAYANAVARTGGELHIIMRAPHTDTQHEGALHVHGVRTPKLLIPWHLARAARNVIYTKSIHVVSAQDPFEHGLAALRAVRGTKAKLHIQVHTDYLSPWFTRGKIFRSPEVRMPFLNRLRIRIADGVVPKADGIRVVSERIKESMMKRYGDAIREPSVIPIPVPTDVPPKVELPPRPFTFTLIAVGRLEPEKRVQDAIAVVRRLKDAYPALGLVVVGEGRERKRLERLARAWGVKDRVLFLGARKDAWGLMQSANAFIQASAYEGYSMTLVEAALAGVPIITSDAGIVGEVFVGYEHVFAAPPGDPSNLAALTARLIEDHLARGVLARQGRRAALEHLARVKNTPDDIIADLAKALTAAPRSASHS